MLKNVGIKVVYNKQTLLIDYFFVVDDVDFPCTRSVFNDVVFGIDQKTLQDMDGFVNLIRSLQ